MKHHTRLIKGLICLTLLASLVSPLGVWAKSAQGSGQQGDTQRYIVVLDDLPLAAYDGRIIMTPERDADSMRLPATANFFTGASKLDVHSPRSRQYLKFLDERFVTVQGEALLELGRQLQPVYRYRNALNGFATDLSSAELRALRNVPGVKAVIFDEIRSLNTDAGPDWIGADAIHDGSAGPFSPTGGEGMVIGIIDSGINWDHGSFEDPGEGAPPGNGVWDHENPRGSQLGLCSDPEVMCNDKLIGVYDFIEDDPDTEDENEHTKGKDNIGHGSHVASVAAGNPVSLFVGGVPTQIAGVAPNANIISYRVCSSADGCPNSAILAAIDQAVADQVDVINQSLGSPPFDPWFPGTDSMSYLNVRSAGIFAATSAGNDGSESVPTGLPGNSPWMTAVGSATHHRVYGSLLEDLSGGDTTPPDVLVGVGLTGGIGITPIVHARDFGNALCGTGEPQLGTTCAANTGVTNPFAPNTFNGQIVVCDRGDYGRIEKGKNVMLAGAAGYVLANTELDGESISEDEHCLPAIHIGENDGDVLRTWLETGSGHEGSISGNSTHLVDEAADVLNDFSSRGPNFPPVHDTMKPDLIAPGNMILGAGSEGNGFVWQWGTSQASPHVTGGAALIRAVHPDWSPAMIASALVMTATPELMIDHDGSKATVLKRGGGRTRLDVAVNAGLYLDETEANFLAADPDLGGNPGTLNLPGLVNSDCQASCSFERTVTDLAGGAVWTATTRNFTTGVTATITPNNFSLANNASRTLDIEIDLTQAGASVGAWVDGEVVLSSNGLPEAVFPVTVFVSGGNLPEEWLISSDEISGWQEFTLDGLAAMPDATFQSGGLVVPTQTTESLAQDPNNDSVYDGSAGLMTVWETVPTDTLWLHTETLQSTAADLDLFVGRDSNGDGVAQASEELCSSTTPEDLELCDFFSPVPGEYWIIVQNWAATNDPDDATLVSAVIGKQTNSKLSASGDGIVEAGASHTVRLSWDNVAARPDTELVGAVGIGTTRDSQNNIGIIPVRFTKTGVEDPETLVLMNGVTRGVTVRGGGSHDRTYIDIPPGVDSLTVTVTGGDAEESENLQVDLYREDFDGAFDGAPFAAAPDMSGSPIASASGSNGNGPTVTVDGNDLVPGRWYAVLINNRGFHAAVTVTADITSSGDPIPLHGGLWQPSSRLNLRQGYDYASTGGYRALLWYTYDELGSPVWYLASAPEPDGNVWVAELLRFTNDGLLQQAAPVGYVSVTTLAMEDSIFSFVLYGDEGSDRMFPSTPLECPTIDNVEQSYSGIWSRLAIGVGGASVLVNKASQAFVHYIYNDKGTSAWLIGADDANQSPTGRVVPLLQFSGYCAVCAVSPIVIETVGEFTRDFADEDNLTWTLDYSFVAPVSGTIDRTDDAGKLTVPLICQ